MWKQARSVASVTCAARRGKGRAVSSSRSARRRRRRRRRAGEAPRSVPPREVAVVDLGGARVGVEVRSPQGRVQRARIPRTEQGSLRSPWWCVGRTSPGSRFQNRRRTRLCGFPFCFMSLKGPPCETKTQPVSRNNRMHSIRRGSLFIRPPHFVESAYLLLHC